MYVNIILKPMYGVHMTEEGMYRRIDSFEKSAITVKKSVYLKA